MLGTSYDFFYKNGVPKWRGTGYYYSRFRPGLVVCTTIMTSCLLDNSITDGTAVLGDFDKRAAVPGA